MLPVLFTLSNDQVKVLSIALVLGEQTSTFSNPLISEQYHFQRVSFMALHRELVTC